jgi:hypothetical protein
MRTYVVQPGESPASIAAKFAGCPKCARDLVPVNQHKTSITLPNGYTEPLGLTPGETLNLPDKWFNGMLDTLPKSYFDNLPGPAGMLADFARGQFALGPNPLVFVPARNVPSASPSSGLDFWPGGTGPSVGTLTPNPNPPPAPKPLNLVNLVNPPPVGGTIKASAPPSSASAPMSTGTKVAIGFGVVVAGGLAWWALS